MPCLALVSTDNRLSERLSSALVADATVTRLSPQADLARGLASLKPALVMVDVVGAAAPDAIRHAASAAQAADARLEVVAVGDAGNANLVISALRAGAVDFVDRTGAEPQLRDQILHRFQPAATAERGGAGGFMVVLAAGGSATANLLAVNLAVLRAGEAGEGLLIDAALPATDADAALDLSPTYSLWDAARDLDRLDRTLLASALVSHAPSGLRLLPLATHATDETALSPESVLRAIGTVRPLFRETVLNLAGVRHPQILAAVLAVASRIVLVAPQSYTALRDAKALLDSLPAETGARGRAILAIEEYSERIGLDDRQMRQTLGLGTAVRLPPAREALLNSLNIGRPLALEAPLSPWTRAVQSLAAEGPAPVRAGLKARVAAALLRLVEGQS